MILCLHCLIKEIETLQLIQEGVETSRFFVKRVADAPIYAGFSLHLQLLAGIHILIYVSQWPSIHNSSTHLLIHSYEEKFQHQIKRKLLHFYGGQIASIEAEFGMRRRLNSISSL